MPSLYSTSQRLARQCVYPAAWLPSNKEPRVLHPGSCFAFAAIAELESSILMKGNLSHASSLDLSEQQVLNCNANKEGASLHPHVDEL